MKMTALALGVKCGFLGASGLTKEAGVAAAARLKKPSAESRPVRATAPKPPPVSQRNSRRVRRQNWRASCFMIVIRRRVRLRVVDSLRESEPTRSASRPPYRKRLIQIHELVRVKHEQTIQLERLI